MKNILTKSRTILEWTHISELNQSQLSQLTDTIVGWAGLKEELHQTHLLTAEQGAHDLPAENEGKSGPLVNKPESIVARRSQLQYECWFSDDPRLSFHR